MGAQSVGRARATFLRAPRYEVFPTDDVLAVVVRHVPNDVTITGTASPRRGMPAPVLLAVALARLGYTAIPHLSARMIRDRVELGQVLGALKAARIHNVFVVAADSKAPPGEVADALALLAALPPYNGLAAVAVADYPAGHLCS